MNVLYEYQAFSREKYGGIPKYFSELMKHLPHSCSFELSVLFSHNQYLKEDSGFFRKITFPWPEKEFSGKSYLKKRIDYLNHQYSLKRVAENDFDILHPTFYDDYFLPYLKKPYVITVHDMIIFKFDGTEDDYTERRKKEANLIKGASRVITISENTKKDVIDILNIDPNKIDVIHHGFNPPSQAEKLEKFGNYILYVGRRVGYKNFSTMVKGIGPLMRQMKDLRLVCVGGPLEEYEINDLNRENILDRTTALRADEKLLSDLYANARVFVFPSKYEGFGMPILEAYANDCPVCLSNASCFPEVAGTAASYFDPLDPDSIEASVKRVLTEDAYRTELVELGRLRLTNYSWTKTASQTAAVYQKVLQS